MLNISNKFLRQVIDEPLTHDIWQKMQSLHDKKDLSIKLYVRARLFSFKMIPTKSLEDNLYEFKKLSNSFNQSGEKSSMLRVKLQY